MTRHRPQRSYGHRIRRLFGAWELRWTVDRYYKGDRLRYPTGYRRFTDERGARRFAKRWGLTFPEDR